MEEMLRPHVIKVSRLHQYMATVTGIISLVFARSVKIINLIECIDLVNFSNIERNTHLRDKVRNVLIIGTQSAKKCVEFDVQENDWTSNFCPTVVGLIIVTLS